MVKREDIRFQAGNLKVAEAVAENGKTTILGGGDTAALTEDFRADFPVLTCIGGRRAIRNFYRASRCRD